MAGEAPVGRVVVGRDDASGARTAAPQRLERGVLAQRLHGGRVDRELELGLDRSDAPMEVRRGPEVVPGLGQARSSSVSRRLRTASASARSVSTVVSQPRQASVIDTP